MKSGIYKIENTQNGKCYVGSAVNLTARINQHRAKLRSGKHINVKLQNAWNKHGDIAFEFSVIECVDDVGSLIEREQHWIDYCDCVANGYNIAPYAGSPLGVKHTSQARENMRVAHLGNKPSEETRVKMSASHAGQKRSKEFGLAISERQRGRVPPRHVIDACRNANIGRKHSDETRAKVSKALTGRKVSEETRAKISASHKGKKHTDEQRKKMSEAAIKRIRVPFSDTHRLNLSIATKRFYESKRNGE